MWNFANQTAINKQVKKISNVFHIQQNNPETPPISFYINIILFNNTWNHYLVNKRTFLFAKKSSRATHSHCLPFNLMVEAVFYSRMHNYITLQGGLNIYPFHKKNPKFAIFAIKMYKICILGGGWKFCLSTTSFEEFLKMKSCTFR